MTKFQKSENAIFFKRVISMTKDGGQYIWPDLGVAFTLTNNKLKAPCEASLKAARSIVSKKDGLKLFTI